MLAPLECINPRRDRWAVRWNHRHDEERGWLAVEMITEGKPSADTVREAITEYYDAITQDRIVNGFYWNGHKVKLTDTAQRNFLFAVYSLDRTGEIDRSAFIGLLEADTDADAADELGDMVAAMWQHIKESRAQGIAAKNAVDYSVYDTGL